MTTLDKQRKQYTLEDCILPPAAVRKVKPTGIQYHGKQYMHTDLQAYIGQEVMLFNVRPKYLLVCIGSELICTIECEPQPHFKSGELVTLKGSGNTGMVLQCDYVNQFYLVQIEGDQYMSHLHVNELQKNQGATL